MYRFLFIGDIVGRPGRRCLQDLLPAIIKEYEVSFVVANGENAAGGVGINPPIFNELREMGIDVLTSGNHIWDKKESYPFLNKEKRLLRPENYSSPHVPGKGSGIFFLNNFKIAVLNLAGRVFMPHVECPFHTAQKQVALLKNITPNIIVDFHAEATSEKKALALFLDGQVTAVIGTHTHVQTADEQILPQRTAFITDVGMTGPYNSILGVSQEPVLKNFTTGLPQKFTVASGNSQFNALLVEAEEKTGKALSVLRLNIINIT